MAKIVLVHPPHTLTHGTQLPQKVKHESLGLYYLASCLRAKGHQVSLIDAQMEDLSLEQVISRLLAAGPYTVIGVSFSAQDMVGDSHLLVKEMGGGCWFPCPPAQVRAGKPNPGY